MDTIQVNCFLVVTVVVFCKQLGMSCGIIAVHKKEFAMVRLIFLLLTGIVAVSAVAWTGDMHTQKYRHHFHHIHWQHHHILRTKPPFYPQKKHQQMF